MTGKIAALIRLAGATMPCPCVARGGLVCSMCAERPGARVVMHGAACLNNCDEASRVFFFEDVRVPCHCRRASTESHIESIHRNSVFDGDEVCDGVRRWTPLSDGWAWWRAGSKVGIHLVLANGGWDGARYTDYDMGADTDRVVPPVVSGDPEVAFFTALELATSEIEGVRMGE